MSLEKGLSRIGTVFGVLIGIFFSIIITFIGLDYEWFNYFKSKEIEWIVNNDYEKPERKEDEDPFVYCLREREQKEKIREKIKKENGALNFFRVFLPTTLLYLIIIFLSFLFVFFLVKSVFGTINWVIKGFRE